MDNGVPAGDLLEEGKTMCNGGCRRAFDEAPRSMVGGSLELSIRIHSGRVGFLNGPAGVGPLIEPGG